MYKFSLSIFDLIGDINRACANLLFLFRIELTGKYVLVDTDLIGLNAYYDLSDFQSCTYHCMCSYFLTELNLGSFI